MDQKCYRDRQHLTMFQFSSRKTRYQISFSVAEQGLACLTALFKAIGFDISPAEIRNGRPVRECGFDSLPSLSLELGFMMDKVNLTSLECLIDLNEPVIIHTHEFGTVILDRSKHNYFWMNNPSQGWKKIPFNKIMNSLQKQYGYILSPRRNQSSPKRKKAQFLIGILSSDRAFLILALSIVFISLLHGISSLLDPVIKNIYFTNVVQMSMIEWARPIALFYFLAAVFTGLLLLISSILAALLTNRMALRWSFSVFSSILRLPSEYMRLRARGDLMSRVRASEGLASFVGTQELMLIGSLLNFLVLVWVLLSISPLLSLILIGFQVLAIYVVFLSNPGRKERSDQLHFHSASETSSFVRLFGNIDKFLLLRRELQAFRFHALRISQRVRAQQRLSTYTSLVNFSTTIIDQVQTTILLVVAAFLIIDGQISLGQYIGFSAMLSLVISPMKRFSRFIGSWQTMQTIHERILDVCEEASISRLHSIQPASKNELLYWHISKITQNQNSQHDFNDPIRIDWSSTNNVLVVDSYQRLEMVESILSGEDILPNALDIKVAYQDGDKKLLVARSKPYVYPKDFNSNVILCTQSVLEESDLTVEMVINELNFELSSNLTQIDMKMLSSKQLYQLGVLRALWQKPEALVIPITIEYSELEQDKFHKNLQALCSRLGIYLILLSDYEHLNPLLWGEPQNLSSYLDFVEANKI